MGAGGMAALGGLQLGMGAWQMIEARKQAKAEKARANFEAGQMEYNAKLIDFAIQDVGRQADRDVNQREKVVNYMLAEQKVGLAGQGIDVGGDLALALEKDERRAAIDDIVTIKNNAWKTTMGLKVEKNDLLQRASFQRKYGISTAKQTQTQGILSGLSTMVSAGDKFSRSGLFSSSANTQAGA